MTATGVPMPMTTPTRPLFQNGQRLTAERLTQAFEFLRTMLRRVLLAPLSSGVAGGFELTPPINDPGTVLVVEPGLAIDGRGRLIVVPDQHRFTAQEIIAAVGGVVPSDAQAVRVCLSLDDASQSNDPCAPQLP